MAPYASVEAEWRWAEKTGFDSAWLPDSFSNRRLSDFEVWTLLASLARSTSRIRIGTLVTTVVPRHPLLLAANALTVDHVSSGRVEVGIGPGDQAEECDVFGVPRYTGADRISRLREQLELLDKLLRGQEVTRAGSSYSVTGARLGPPVQLPRPPLVVSAEGPRALRLTARFADAWSTLGGQWAEAGAGGQATEEQALRTTKEKVEHLERLAGELGRAKGSIRRMVLAYRQKVDPLSSLDAFDHFVGSYAEVGIDEFVFYWPPLAHIRDRSQVTPERRSVVERIAASRLSPMS